MILTRTDMCFKRCFMKYPGVLAAVMVVFNLCFNCVLSDNFTHAYRTVPGFGKPKHQPRFLSFNTEEDGDLEVELEFAVPFISIPVKKTIDAAMGLYHGSGPIANINIGSIILAGATVFGAAVVVPLVISLISKYFFVSSHHERSSDQSNETWRIMTQIDQALIENNIDTTSCMQRTVCWFAKNSRNKLNNGEANSQDKILDGLMTNYWVNQMIEGSAIQTAIQMGLDNMDCAEIYKNCKITQAHLQAFASNFAKYLQINK